MTLTVNQIPAHTHPLLATASIANDGRTPVSHVLGPDQHVRRSIEAPAPTRRWRRSRSSSVGGSQPHDNFQPYLCVNFIISLFGIFPSQPSS